MVKRVCNKCGIEKAATELVKHRQCRDGVAPYCLECQGRKRKARYRADPSRAKRATAEWGHRNPAKTAEYERRHRAKKAGWIYEPGTFDRLMVEQDGRCAICRVRPDKSLHVDHDHKTGIVRGLLCDLCNRGLGYFEDDPERFARAGEYLLARGPRPAPRTLTPLT